MFYKYNNCAIFSVSKQAIRGMIATFILLNRAEPLFSRGRKSWVKSRNFDKASIDFYSVSPSNVRKYELQNGVSIASLKDH